jgi:hypothetical protein
MVTVILAIWSTGPSCAATGLYQALWITFAQLRKDPQLPIERLDPITRVNVLAALTGLIILMFGLMFLAWLGARWARNYANRPPVLFEDRKKNAIDPDDWASRRIVREENDRN